MNTAVSSFQDIIEIWPSAADFGRACGAEGSAAANMHARNSIDAGYFPAIVREAAKMGRADITLELLCELAAERKRQSAKKKPNKKDESG